MLGKETPDHVAETLLEQVDNFLTTFWTEHERLSHPWGWTESRGRPDTEANVFETESWLAPDDPRVSTGIEFYRRHVIPMLQRLEA